MEKRKGRQEPTTRFTLPYQKTEGTRAVERYRPTVKEIFPWEISLVYDIMSVGEDGLWVHDKFGYSVPRQNGKNEVICIVEMDGLLEGLRQIHTAHRTSTSTAAFKRLCARLEAAGYHERNSDHPDGFRSGKSKGQEFIEMPAKDGGGVIQFRTRTTTGGLGETFDRLIIDEAQEYSEDQESALKYTIVSSHNPQTILLGTPPTPYSSGTIFPKYRRETLCGDNENCGWAEWSVQQRTDPRDVEAWYNSNPSLGYTLTERNIRSEIGSTEDSIIDFNVQRLGLWISYNQKSAISETEWNALQVEKLPKMHGKLCIGVKFNQNGASCALSVAAKTDKGIFHETIACKSMREGVDWIAIMAKRMDYCKLIVDGQNGLELLQKSLKDFGLKPAYAVTVKDFIEASAFFEQGIFGGTLFHMDQPSVKQIATNCEKRAIGAHGGFGYKSLRENYDVSILESIVLAVWGCEKFAAKAVKRKQIRC